MDPLNSIERSLYGQNVVQLTPGIQRVTKAKVFRIKHRWCQRDSYIFEPYNTSNQTNISMIEESHTKDLSSSSNNNQFHTYIQALQHFLIPIPLLKRI